MLQLGVQLVPNLSPTYQNRGATALASCVLAKAHNDAELDVSHSCLSGLPSLLFPSLLNRHNLPRFPIRAKPEELDGLQVNRWARCSNKFLENNIVSWTTHALGQVDHFSGTGKKRTVQHTKIMASWSHHVENGFTWQCQLTPTKEPRMYGICRRAGSTIWQLDRMNNIPHGVMGWWQWWHVEPQWLSSSCCCKSLWHVSFLRELLGTKVWRCVKGVTLCNLVPDGPCLQITGRTQKGSRRPPGLRVTGEQQVNGTRHQALLSCWDCSSIGWQQSQEKGNETEEQKCHRQSADHHNSVQCDADGILLGIWRCSLSIFHIEQCNLMQLDATWCASPWCCPVTLTKVDSESCKHHSYSRKDLKTHKQTSTNINKHIWQNIWQKLTKHKQTISPMTNIDKLRVPPEVSTPRAGPVFTSVLCCSLSRENCKECKSRHKEKSQGTQKSAGSHPLLEGDFFAMLQMFWHVAFPIGRSMLQHFNAAQMQRANFTLQGNWLYRVSLTHVSGKMHWSQKISLKAKHL